MLKLPTLADAPHAAPEPRDHGRDLLRNLAAGGASSLVKALLQLMMLPLMGRLLGPKEFGLYATVLPILAFFTVIADGGLGASLAKERSTDRVVWSTAFWAMLVLGVCLAALVNLCGVAVATLMHEPSLQGLMAVLSLSLLFIAASTLPSARLIQRNDLVSLSAIDMVATLIGAVAAIVCAVRGLGAFSLAIQSVTTFGVRAVAMNAIAFELPGRAFSLPTLAGHLNTGGVLVGTRLIDMLCRFGENVLFSLAFGPAVLGSYTFANQICRFFCECASNPVWSATYAQTLKVTGAGLTSLVRNMTRLMLLATFPIACIAAVSAPAIFPLVLGAKWQHAGLFLQILICSYAFAATASVGSAVFLASGRNRLFLGSTAFLSIGRVAAVAAGPWIGALGAVCAIALIQVVYAGVMAIAVERTHAMPTARLLGALGPTLAAGAVGALVCLVTLHAAPSALATSFASALLGGAAALAVLATIDKSFTLRALKQNFARVRGRA